jgi:DNA modification methylase
MSYQDVADKYRTSRGAIYRIAVQNEARKNESRIQERRRERQMRQNEFLAEVMNATQKADVLDFLDGLPDGSVHLHLASPPFNVGKSYGGSPDIDRLRHHYYLGFMLQVLSEMNRTLADGGVLALQVGQTKDDAGRLYPLDTLFFSYLRDMGCYFRTA